MAIELQFSQEQLETLADLLAQRLNNNPQPILSKGINRYDDMTVREVIKETSFSMSVRLYSLLNRNFPGYTMKQLAGVIWKCYRRVGGMGARSYDELCRLFEKLGYEPGYNFLRYDYDKKVYYIEER